MQKKVQSPFVPFSMNIRGSLVEFKRPAVMGIINATPDSFFKPSRAENESAVAAIAREMIAEGVDIIDIGAVSSRPGASEVSPEEELARLSAALKAVRSVSVDIPVSVDTCCAAVAREAVENYGADIINDISAGNNDPAMIAEVARLHVPYVMMHMRGTPVTMQSETEYPDGVTAGVISELSKAYNRARLAGVCDIIIDPGLGFAKTTEQNYALLRDLPVIASMFPCPILVGASRKSMVTVPLGITAAEALNGTTVINTIALLSGASIIRVHDVKAARQAVELISLLNNSLS